MFLGWKTLHVDQYGNPTHEHTPWVASCFILFVVVIYIGEIRAIKEGATHE